MNTQKIEIKKLEKSQIQKASQVLGKAFNQDPIFAYIASENPLEKANLIESSCQMLLRYSQCHNQIYTTTDELKGIAAWIPPGYATDNILRLFQAGIITVLFNIHIKKILISLSMLFTAEKYHKQMMKQPHWYLMMLGVSPDFQGQGIGGMLLEPVLQQADIEGLPCYLETSTQAAVRFYQRHGFEIAWNGELAPGSPQLWIMIREPKAKK
ncbi:GNAT family N-acetyltransferase [Calothrix sp. UHCC 0171]|uniref:GNAT family N-acetyltransferase n=1 Tax=Calothrix sp. UHCC 0171 TaxID=3110245 RepID=UPI002B203DFF|nr:GNAT family N-acetyltransferase [Calothrix sp. UHCC 0171]MEA5570116.1 GNAT family N-acetyltransferase [Calothrix sp. UHCC 0171]